MACELGLGCLFGAMQVAKFQVGIAPGGMRYDSSSGLSSERGTRRGGTRRGPQTSCGVRGEDDVTRVQRCIECEMARWQAWRRSCESQSGCPRRVLGFGCVFVPGSTRRSVRHLEGHDTLLRGDTG